MSVGLFIAVGIVLVAAGGLPWLAVLANAEIRRLRASVLGARKEPPSARVPAQLATLAERFGPIPEGAVALCLRQTGEMRLSPTGDWLPFRAEAVFSLDAVAFVWDAWVRMMPGVRVRVMDAYDGTRGILCVRLFGIVPVVVARGADIDRAEVQRYIAELAWNPVAFNRNGALAIAGQGANEYAVHYSGDPSTRVDLRLAEDGTIAETYTDARPMRAGGETVERPWAGDFSGWGTVGAFAMPRRGRVSWLLPGGEYEYWRGDIRQAVFLDADGNALSP
ncbi:DUF6920 family protein [Pelagibacterium halotolerans]|uniref:DUF6920 family protein n=1 Tax=Pelagibacterium halotolerans TaxID=531813 RepID=UPI00384AFAC6